MNFLFVALGGAVGAMARYAISLIPLKTEFPFLTLITNVIGAILIGFIVGITSGRGWSIQKYGFVLEDRRMRWLYHVFYIFTGSL